MRAWASVNSPKAPIVGYLTRSSSTLSALLAGLLWVISFDLRRHAPVLRYLSWAVIVLGVVLFAINVWGCPPPGPSRRARC